MASRDPARHRLLTGLEERIHARIVRNVAGQHRRDVRYPGVDLHGQVRTADCAEPGEGKAPQHGAWQSLGDQAQRRLVDLRRNPRQEATGAGAQYVLWGGLLDSVVSLDQEQVDRAGFDEPGALGI